MSRLIIVLVALLATGCLSVEKRRDDKVHFCLLPTIKYLKIYFIVLLYLVAAARDS